MDKTTIAAISTPLGPGGIGIIRVSGHEALPILKKIFVPSTKKLVGKADKKIDFRSHHVYYGTIREIDSHDVIDEVLVFCMKGPNSYTKEDVVEIQSHSGYVILDRILSTVFDAGATLAKPGEFTQRAFLNGRIDITQAEAVIDLINAPCETAANIASRQVSGSIRGQIETLIGLVDDLRAKCEAIIEFDESDDLALSADLMAINSAMHHSLLPQINALIQNQKSSAVFCEGVLLTIAGVPNVGKSSLLNQLVEKETAIVSEIPGTTRDVIREYLSINGIPITLCDTAGLHETQDPVECIGIDKAHDHIDRAQLLLFVIEAVRRLNPFEEKFLADNSTNRVIVILNKIDIANQHVLHTVRQRLKKFRFIEVSAKTGKGIGDLRTLIFRSLVGEHNNLNVTGATPNLRQRKILEKIGKIIFERDDGDGNPSLPELITDDLRRIKKLLEEITGTKANSDIYDRIFSQFCIGK